MANERFGEYLSALIEEKGLTKYRLGKDSGVAQDLIGKIERSERNATDEVLERLAPHLGVSPVELKARAALDRMDPEVRAFVLQGGTEPVSQPRPLTNFEKRMAANKARQDEEDALRSERARARDERLDPDKGKPSRAAWSQPAAAAGEEGVEDIDPDHEDHEHLDGDFPEEI